MTGWIRFTGSLCVSNGHAKCFCNSFTIGRVAGMAVTNMAIFDEVQRIAHCTGSIVKQDLLLFRCHQFKQGTRLAEIVMVIFTIIPEIRITIDF